LAADGWVDDLDRVLDDAAKIDTITSQAHLSLTDACRVEQVFDESKHLRDLPFDDLPWRAHLFRD